jgi:hypothetical protein
MHLIYFIIISLFFHIEALMGAQWPRVRHWPYMQSVLGSADFSLCIQPCVTSVMHSMPPS